MQISSFFSLFSVCLKCCNYLWWSYKSSIYHMHALDGEVIASVRQETKKFLFFCELLFYIIEFVLWKKESYRHNILQMHDIIEYSTLECSGCHFPIFIEYNGANDIVSMFWDFICIVNLLSE